MRAYLAEHRHELAVTAARDYPADLAVEGTPLLAPPAWRPDQPIPLRDLAIGLDPDAPFTGITGTGHVAEDVLPVRPDGTRYARYSDAVADLAAPGVFQNRWTYRLLAVDLRTRRMAFSLGRYFDGMDVGDACAHEYAAAVLGESTERRLRTAVDDPCDPARRPVNLAISTLTLRHDPATGDVRFLMHRRGTRVGHAGGMYQVIPVGMFQPAADQPHNLDNDFDLWRSMVREYAEELLGQPEQPAENAPIDYDAWPFAARLTAARDAGQARAYCLGLGVDPLTLATDLLAAVVIDAATYDELFGAIVDVNPEGDVLPVLPFTHDAVERFAAYEPTQAAGAALLRLAWHHRHRLLAW